MAQTEIEEIVLRLRAHGTDTPDIEAKASARALPRSVRESISAFANGSGGTVVLGLAEEDGFAAVGVEDPVKVRDDLASLCADGFVPPVRAEIEIVSFEDRALVVAVVPETPRGEKPCYVKDQGIYTGSYIRGGDGDRHLTQYEVGVLIAGRGQPRDDAELVSDAGVDDLDPDAVARLLRRVRERQPAVFGAASDEIALVRMKVLGRHDGRLAPTIAGLMALGAYPQEHFPQLHLTFVSIPATAKDRVPADGPRFLDNQTITGSIPVMVAEALRVITRNMSTRATVTGSGRTDSFDYPREAIREAVVNALLHRDYAPGARGTQVQVEMYQDRLMIRSPGGLFGAVTEDDLGQDGVSSSRNGHLSMLLMDVTMPDGDRLVAENRGSGIPAMLATLRRSGMSPPEFVSRVASFSVTFPKHSLLDGEVVAWLHTLGEDLSETQCIALALMREGRVVSNASMRQLGLDSRDATAALVGLVERGLARSWGGRRYARYELQAEPDAMVVTKPASSIDVVERGQRASTDVRLDQVRGLLLDRGEMAASEVAEALGVTDRSALTYLTRLIDTGEVEPTAPPRSTRRRYRPTGRS